MGKKVKNIKLENSPKGEFLFDFDRIIGNVILHLEKQHRKEETMSEANRIILRQCSPRQAEKIQELLADKWIIEEYDESNGHVLMKKRCASQWVKQDGYTCSV